MTCVSFRPTHTPKIVFEGVVGRNSLGNIAIDDVSIVPGVCPSETLYFFVRSLFPFFFNNSLSLFLLRLQRLRRWPPPATATAPSRTTPAGGATPRGGTRWTSSTGRGWRPGTRPGSRRRTTPRGPEKVRCGVEGSGTCSQRGSQPFFFFFFWHHDPL